MKYHQGKFTPKNPKKYRGDANNIIFRSSWELAVLKWCDRTDSILEYSSEETVIPYLYEVDKKYHRYFVDLKIKFDSGEVLLVEIKPDAQTRAPVYPGKRTKRYLTESLEYIKNQNKWVAAEKYAADRGWRFEVWTEKILRKKGILPKQLKPLKKLKRL